MDSEEDSFQTPLKPKRSASQRKFGETTLTVGSPFSVESPPPADADPDADVDPDVDGHVAADAVATTADTAAVASADTPKAGVKKARAKKGKAKKAPVGDENARANTPTPKLNLGAAGAGTGSSSKATQSPRVGYKKKLIRLFSSHGDFQNSPAAESAVSAKMYAERKAELDEEKAKVSQYEREVFALNVQLSKLKAALEESDAARQKWQTRCLKQKAKIEKLEEANAKMTEVMRENRYVAGTAYFDVRAPSFCPEF